MFKLTLNPISSDKETDIEVLGDTLIIDGNTIDFSPLEEGEECEVDLPLTGVAKRINGVIEVGVLLSYSTRTAEPMQSKDINDYIVLVSEGKVPDVIKRRVVEDITFDGLPDFIPKDSEIITIGEDNAEA